jgi:hypothetical protein
MTIFRPCIGCIIRNDCEIKKSVIVALRGQPTTSATIRCKIPFEQHFPPGTRVYVTVAHIESMDEYGHCHEDLAAATVIGPSRRVVGKLVCHLDDPVNWPGSPDKPVKFRVVWPKDAVPTGEPRADYCDTCNRGFVDGECRCDYRSNDL